MDQLDLNSFGHSQGASLDSPFETPQLVGNDAGQVLGLCDRCNARTDGAS